MKRVLCFSLLLSVIPVAAPADIIDSLSARYCRSLAGADAGLVPALELLARTPREAEVSDQNVVELQQRYPVTQAEADSLVAALRPDGTWPDINYADTLRSGWAPKRHVERLHALARRHYVAPAPATAEALHRALGYWLRERPVCRNWWYNQIGVPRTLGQACLLFAPSLTEAERRGVGEVMRQARFGMTGQNKVWLAGNVLLCALLEADTALVRRARDEIASELVTGRAEGIQPDWSFHQHGPQPQWGNYGLSFLSGMSFYAELFDATPYAFAPRQRALLDSLLVQGYRWVLWRGRFDVNALGRQLFRNADRDKGVVLLLAAQSLRRGASSDVVDAVQRLADENFFHPDRPTALTGYRHFCSSDQTLYRTPGWMASVRMASQRVVGTEQVNEDNLQGYYMADGALYTYVRGDEYSNIFPLWNWRRIPGITAPDVDGLLPRRQSRNRTLRVGGVGDGEHGLTAMELNRDGVHVRKAWVFAPGFVLCLGADVRADRAQPLVTTVEQRRLAGDVWQGHGRWHHDGTGYVVLDADSVGARTEHRRGRWHDVMGMYPPAWIEGDVFELTLHHAAGHAGSYQYVVLPGASRRQTRRFRPDRAFRVERNDSTAQVVRLDSRRYVALYAPADVLLDGGRSVRLDTPGLYVLDAVGRQVAVRPFAQDEAALAGSK